MRLKEVGITQLAHRFGVRCGDPILIDCGGARAAEVTAVFACIRCGAPFVPIADASLSVNAQNILHVIDTTRPMAAIVVGNSDEHVRVLSLNALGVFRIVLLDEMGCLVEAESAVCDVREDLPHVPLTGDLALYILFTSGSSGRPKGCVGTHKGLVSHFNVCSCSLSANSFCGRSVAFCGRWTHSLGTTTQRSSCCGARH